VSSILKALKKIETTETAEEPGGRRTPFGLQAMLAPPFGARWYARRGVLWALAGVCLAAGAAAYYGWPALSRPPQTTGVAREVRLPLPPGQTAPPTAPALPPASSVEDAPAGEAQAKASPPIQLPPPTSRIRPREAGPTASSETRPPPAPRSTPAQDRAPTARPAPGRSPEDSLNRLEESKLKVMAIAWAHDPARRLAIVNGHIVKEGESVEGFNVIQIRKDDIIVNDGGRSWRVELNLGAKP
jgi:hypothetical protein